MHTSPQCPTCRFNVITRYLIAGKPTESRRCERNVVFFPNATDCRDFEREPGTD